MYACSFSRKSRPLQCEQQCWGDQGDLAPPSVHLSMLRFAALQPESEAEGDGHGQLAAPELYPIPLQLCPSALSHPSAHRQVDRQVVKGVLVRMCRVKLSRQGEAGLVRQVGVWLVSIHLGSVDFEGRGIWS